MPAPEAFVYPLLLAATVAIYRVGRPPGERRTGLFEWTRLVTLAILLGVVTALQVRFAASGMLLTPLAIFGAALSIAAVLGLLGLHVIAVMDASRGRPDSTPQSA